MKERAKGFAAGILTAALVGALGFTALAASGQVSFNASALSLNGTQVSAKGENYTLANGQSVPSSITYTDETGGGTTYLPVRRISELLGVETGWDGATGSVTVKGEVKAPVATTPPAAVDKQYTLYIFNQGNTFNGEDVSKANKAIDNGVITIGVTSYISCKALQNVPSDSGAYLPLQSIIAEYPDKVAYSDNEYIPYKAVYDATRETLSLFNDGKSLCVLSIIG